MKVLIAHMEIYNSRLMSRVVPVKHTLGFHIMYNHHASCVSRRNNLIINSHFVSCTCGLYINTKVGLFNSISV